MGDITIRVNKRTLERSFFIIVILALGAALFLLRAPQLQDDSATVLALEERVSELASENERLSADLESAQRLLRLEEDAASERDGATATEPADEPAGDADTEPEALSGTVSVAWDTRMDPADDERLDRVILTMQNGLDSAVELTYNLHWEGFYEDKVRVLGTVELDSGEQFYEYLVQDGSGLTSNPPGSVDTLILEVIDSEGTVVKRLTKVVR